MILADTKDTENYTVEKLGIERKLFEEIRTFFQRVKDHAEFGFEQQYLSHLIRTLECHMRNQLGHPFFNIVLQKLPDDDPCLDVGTVKYSPRRHFVIFYHPRMDKKQLRVCLAHELGHLFVAALLNKEKIGELSTKPVSTLLGIFCILDKDDFYTSKAIELCHKSPQAVVDSFVQMNNRKQGLLHNS